MSQLSTLILVAAGLAATSCSTSPVDVAALARGAGTIRWLPAGAEILPDALMPISAESGRSLFVDGSASVAFTLTGDREELSTGIVRHFTTRGWCQRSTQYLNPQLATSFSEGWAHRCACLIMTDLRGKPVAREPLYQWRGEWNDSRGDVVTYSLSAEGRQLRGYAAYIPKRSVDAAERLVASRGR